MKKSYDLKPIVSPIPREEKILCKVMHITNEREPGQARILAPNTDTSGQQQKDEPRASQQHPK